MSQPRRSFQDAFFSSLDNVGRAGQTVGENLRARKQQQMDEELQPARVAKANADAGTSKANFESLMREKELMGAMEQSGALTPRAQAGTPTADGNAVDMNQIKSAQDADRRASLWNSLHKGDAGFTPVTGEMVRKTDEDKALASNKADQAATDIESSKSRFGNAVRGDAGLNESEKAFYGMDPKAYGDRLKPVGVTYLPGEGGYVGVPSKVGPGGTPAPAATVKDESGATVKPKPPKESKSLAEIEAEAAARARGAAAEKPERAPTEDQSKAANFARRMELAMGDLSEVEKAGYDRTSTLASARAAGPDAANSSEGQRYSNAEKNFASANLRKESGAVIGKDEMAAQEKLYFPRFGDSPGTVEQKKRNREQAFQGMKGAAGAQYAKVPLVSSGSPESVIKPQSITKPEEEDEYQAWKKAQGH